MKISQDAPEPKTQEQRKEQMMRNTDVQRQRHHTGTWYPVILVRGVIFTPEDPLRMTTQEVAADISMLKSSLGSPDLRLFREDPPTEQGKPFIKIAVPANGTRRVFSAEVNPRKIERTFDLLSRQLTEAQRLTCQLS